MCSLKLRNKILIIIFVIIISLSALSFYVLSISSSTYNKILHNQVKSILDLFSVNVEQNLESIDKITYNILINEGIQDILTQISNNTPYEMHIQREIIENHLLKHTQGSKFITSAQIIDSKSQRYISGLSYPKIDYSPIISSSEEMQGKIIWTIDSSYPNILILARDIRELEQLSLEKIGTLIVTIDLDKLIKYSSTTTNVMLDNIVIASNEEIYYSSPRNQQLDISDAINTEYDYKIENINNEKFFVTKNTSTYTNFTYIHFVPYNSVFEKQNMLQQQILLSIGIITIISVLLGTLYTKTITEPLNQLYIAMQNVKAKDFKLHLTDFPSYHTKDEIGFLYNGFEEMITRINVLVNDKLLNEISHVKTKFKMLQSQINPHFLYNTLDSINWMARMKNQADIARMAKSLASILRNSINSHNESITIKDEIALLNDYIFIQHMRYEDRLDYDYFVDSGLMNYRIPKMIIQPILENSIIHSLEPRDTVCKIRLTIRSSNNELIITLNDNGIGITEEEIKKILSFEIKQKSHGIGIKNIIERLNLLYDNNYSFSMESTKNEGTTTNIKLPLAMNVKELPYD